MIQQSLFNTKGGIKEKQKYRRQQRAKWQTNSIIPIITLSMTWLNTPINNSNVLTDKKKIRSNYTVHVRDTLYSITQTDWKKKNKKRYHENSDCKRSRVAMFKSHKIGP